MKKRTLVTVLACMLCVALGISGTLAWLTATSDEVKNTFTTSDISIELKETKGGENREFKMIPGYTIDKDPKVTVLAGSEACYLFVKVEESENVDTFLTYDIADGWTELEDVNGVYYREVAADQMGTAFSVLKDDQVTVNTTVTETDMATAKGNEPTLTFTAYACQLYKNNTEKFTAAEAWANAKSAA